MQKKKRLELRDMAMIGMLAAICVIATSIKIPFGVGAMIHLGTAAVFLIGILFGGIYAGLAAAIGSAFFDLLLGFSPYTLWSFVIKGAAGFTVGSVAHGLWPEKMIEEKWVFRAVLGMALAASCTLGGYVIAWWAVSGSISVALGNMPGSLMTSGVGAVIAMLLAPKLRKILTKR
ncbi:ECF transporter S component [Anaerosinus massiliensis]|uniref:ECF transporter S component n=1 Tax=Massilibacillus massiliensis TaxID=1806837 RepID=UPI000A45AD10|nr:ECF transporter S component [Massilibacillus massiliensis]